jgi:O-succinylbenzoic acid--CoA ligase
VIAYAPWLASRARISASHRALEIAGEAISYGELQRRARAAAGRLRGLGVGPGDVVATLLGNGAPFVELLHAAALCGAALLPLNVRLTPRELAQQLRDAGARLLLHEAGALQERARAAAADASGTQTRATAGAARAFADAAADVPAGETIAAVAADSPLAILFTSGTSGTPKGAQLSHDNFLWSALASAVHLGVDPRDRWLACMPLFHVGGLSILLRAALYGNSVVVHERFDPAAVNRAFDRDGITCASLVASMLARILDDRGERPAPPQLRCVLLGGGPAPMSLIERARALGFPIAPTYGLTEAASQVATRAPGDAAPGAGLRPLLGNEVRVVDGEERDLPDGAPGELLLRGPSVMRGYVNRPAETAATLRGGWLHTGDIAVRAGDGTLEILERRSDLILSGGENVYPSEIEAALREHPAVADAAVAAVKDPDFGQRPAAWLVFRPGTAPDGEQLRAFCRERLAGYKVPVAFHGVADLPRNAAGKLLRHELRGGPAPAR